MSEGPLTDCLDHIAQAATDARSFIEDQNKDSFLFEKRTPRAVVMSLVIVGDAATKAMERYPEFVARHPEVPWRSMRGMRNRIAHGYFDINLDVVWDTVHTACRNCWIVSLPSGKTPRRTMQARHNDKQCAAAMTATSMSVWSVGHCGESERELPLMTGHAGP